VVVGDRRGGDSNLEGHGIEKCQLTHLFDNIVSVFVLKTSNEADLGRKRGRVVRNW
jgi:hypothetical protein